MKDDEEKRRRTSGRRGKVHAEFASGSDALCLQHATARGIAEAGQRRVADRGKAMRYFGGSPTRGRDGGTGRRSRLKICRPLWSWGFDPPSRHQTYLIVAVINNGKSLRAVGACSHCL